MVEAGINQRKTPTTRPSSPARIPVTTLYEYDDAGNRTAATDALNVRVEYAYDALNRLMVVDYVDTSTSVLRWTRICPPLAAKHQYRLCLRTSGFSGVI